MYDYLFLDLQPPVGTPTARAAHEAVRAAGLGDAEVLGVFAPQLGWHARQAAVLLRWPDTAQDRAGVAALGKAPGVGALSRDRLTPTARPAATDRPPAGGIYVHRWFVIETPALAEFLELSTTGWKDFEARFETHIYGLFTAEQTTQDKAAGLTRLLLLTRYRDHGVWETSRDPSTAAMAAFQRRARLTRDSWAASTLLAL
jgi:hypothetical protein